MDTLKNINTTYLQQQEIQIDEKTKQNCRIENYRINKPVLKYRVGSDSSKLLYEAKKYQTPTTGPKYQFANTGPDKRTEVSVCNYQAE